MTCKQLFAPDHAVPHMLYDTSQKSQVCRKIANSPESVTLIKKNKKNLNEYYYFFISDAICT